MSTKAKNKNWEISYLGAERGVGEWLGSGEFLAELRREVGERYSGDEWLKGQLRKLEWKIEEEKRLARGVGGERGVDE